MSPKLKPLPQRVIVITGASDGIGAAAPGCLSANGHKVGDSSQDAVSGPRAIVALHEEDIMTELASTLSIPQERVLLQELNHRISNEFFSAMSLVSLTAARSSSDEVKVALSGVTELLRHYAEVHQALQSPQDDARIDAATCLSKLCLSIRRSKLDQLKIDLVLAAPPLVLQSDECWLLGMIVYELITNAARHAFAGKNGEIRVELLRAGAFVQCKVLDNGAAPANAQRGRGLKIVGELIKALDGRFEQKFGTAGSTSILTFPYSERTARPREQRLRRERHCGK